MKHIHTFEDFINENELNEFGPMSGSGNTDQLDIMKLNAAKKSERNKTVYVVGGKYGTYKLSNKEVKDDTYAAYHNGVEIDF